MSDGDLRALERRFRETGSVEDEAAWARARVQAGQLELARLELAAAFGHPAALLICPEQGFLEQVSRRSVRLGRARWEALDLVIPARVGWALSLIAAEGAATPRSASRDACEDWILDTSAENLQAVTRFTNWDLWHAWPDERLPRPEVMAVGPILIPQDLVGELIEGYLNACLGRGPLDVSALLAEVRLHLNPWLLGLADPLRERVAARQNGPSSAGGDSSGR